MEEQRKISDLLDRISQPGFLVKENIIQNVNQAAQALLLMPGQVFSDLLHTGNEEYADFQEGQICLTLLIGEKKHSASISRMEDLDLVLLDPEEDLDEFRSMSLVSMELRKPLMSVLSSAGKLLDQVPDETEENAKLNRNLMQMLRMVCNMADVSRYATSCRTEIRDIDGLLQELFEKADALTGADIHVHYEGLKTPVFCLVDAEQLERAVWNILSNSMKFSPQNGHIHAKLTRHGSMLHLTVRDSGTGIAEAVRSTLFHRYLRQPGIEDSRYGLGLGLAIVRTVASNHGGTVLISESKTGGTKTTMTIAIRQSDSNILRSPLLRPDYTGGWDHALVELSECLDPELYTQL